MGLGSEVPQVEPPVQGDSGLGPNARGVDQQSRVKQARVGGPAVSTSSPGRLRPWSEAHGVANCTGRLGPFPSARSFDQMFQVTQARVRVLVG